MTPRFLPLVPSTLASALLAIAPAQLPAQTGPAQCAPDDAGLRLPAGFCAQLVGENLGPVRHLAVAPNGDVFAARRDSGVIVLRDTTRDGRADIVARFYLGSGGSGIALASDAVYFAPNDRVMRFPWTPGQLAPRAPAETIAVNLPVGGHAAKGIALGPGNALFVSIGSRTNSCQPPEGDRRGPVPGVNPCTELETRAGVWRFDARGTMQQQSDGKRWATGLRNPMALTVQPGTGTLYAGVHGRDNLTENWNWEAEEGRENPAETVFPLPDGADAGWPYCYLDSRKKVRLLNPEYGGDGAKAGDCEKKAMSAVIFPGHWAPNAITFYGGSQFPARYRNGLFVAFHGSWNRGPRDRRDLQEGYRVTFSPFENGKATGGYETFAAPAGDHFSIRPTGLAVGPDGALYISADAQGKIWKVSYVGER
ncbi:MAG: PQQ-dependent sugar dehydrogenase [Gemmatimonadales bacterium]